MAKAPRAGEVKTRLAASIGAAAAAELYAGFLEDTFAICRAVSVARGVDVMLFHSGDPAAFEAVAGAPSRARPQADGDLGTRLARCFGSLFCEGYDAVVAIGADSPTLPVAVVIDAFERLARGAGAVTGPTSDGGYYLIGLGGTAPDLFRDVPWSTERVLEVTRARAARIGLRLELLTEWYDVDEADDLARLADDLERSTDLAPATRTRLTQLSPYPWRRP